jgi:hypothetical protein
LGHHVIILCHSLLNLGASMLAADFAAGPKIGFVDLAIVPYNIDDYVVLIRELCDALDALVPSHDGEAVLECLDKCHGSGRGHREPVIFSEFLASLLVNRLSQLA